MLQGDGVRHYNIEGKEKQDILADGGIVLVGDGVHFLCLAAAFPLGASV